MICFCSDHVYNSFKLFYFIMYIFSINIKNLAIFGQKNGKIQE